MTLVRFKNDFTPSVHNLFDSYFGNSLSDLFTDSAVIRQIPAVNIKETETNFLVELAAPGLKKEDFKINLEKDVLTISSEKEHEEKTEEDGYKRREFSYSSFKRSFTLPELASKEDIAANYENGVLVISIPKLKIKEDSVRTISIS